MQNIKANCKMIKMLDFLIYNIIDESIIWSAFPMDIKFPCRPASSLIESDLYICFDKISLFNGCCRTKKEI